MSLPQIPPSLADMGLILFGDVWRESLANALEVTEDQIIAWLEDPAGMPVNLEARIERIGKARIEEIRFILEHMAENGLDRSGQ
jgi:hypothetical protein